MERANSSFEDQWQQAFDGVEKTPPEHVWTSIDGMLANQEASKSKKRVIFFKWVAAASVLLAVVSSIALFDKTFNTESVVAVTEKVEDSAIESNDDQVIESADNAQLKDATEEGEQQTAALALVDDNNEEGEEDEQQAASLVLIADHNEEHVEERASTLQNIKSDLIINEPVEETSVVGLASMRTESTEENNLIEKVIQTEGLEEFLIVESIAYQQDESLNLWMPEQLYGVPILSAIKDVEKYEILDLWAGVSFGSGSFNPGSAGGGESQDLAFAPSEIDQGFISNAEQIPVMNTYSAGSSFAAGLDVGSRLSKKIVLRSGLFYNQVSPGSSTNIIVTDNQTNTSYALAEAQESARLNDGLQNNSLSFSQGTTNFNNTLQYLSIPLKAGYIIIDRKVNLVFNSGVSTNILVGSSLNNPDGGLSNFSSGETTDTFSATYFDLLTSIELGYRLKEKYYISLEPNYRRAINNYTKSESTIEGKPTNVGVSLGVKYNF